MQKLSSERTETVSFKVTKILKAELEIEAWEEQLSLNDYIRGLLERRGKWSRSVGKAGGYDIGPTIPRKK